MTLSTPSRVLQGSVWPSISTGVSPNHHGLYLRQQLRNGTYVLTDTYADHVKQKRFYQHLGEAGVRCGVADLPADQPTADFSGIQVVDWAPEFRFWGYETVPRSFARYINSHIGRNPMTQHWSSGDSQASHAKLCRALETSTRLKAKLGHYFIERQDLDMVFFVFGEAHKAGHWLWKYFDVNHPNHEVCGPELENGLLNSYRQIDAALADLVASVSPEDNLVVFSDHGIQAAYRGDHLVDEILERLGLLTYRLNEGHRDNADNAAASQAWFRQLYARAKFAAKRFLPDSMLSRIKRTTNSFPTIDWEHTSAFSLPTDRSSYIRINLKGREPSGIVEPARYDSVLNQLESAFRALVNPQTGGLAVEEVFRVREVFPGAPSDDLPDVVVLWSANAPIDSVMSPELGVIEHRIREIRSGNHRAEGFLLARGPNFIEEPKKSNAHILQIAPTILHLHGVAIPEQYEMAPLFDILR